MVKFQVNDRLLVYILIGIMAVLSVVTISGNRDAEEAARAAAVAAKEAAEASLKGDLIAECLTPGSRCAQFRAENDRLEQQNVRAQNRCILEGILFLHTDETRLPREGTAAVNAFLGAYDDCVVRESQVAVPDPIPSEPKS